MQRTSRLIALGIAVAAGAAALRGAVHAEEAEERLHDPMAVLAEKADDAGRPILTGFASYDHAAISKAVAALEARAGTDKATEWDPYLIAQGRIEIGTIRRFYEKHAEDDMPEALAALDPDTLAEEGLAQARSFAEKHAEHSDIQRVIGDLKSLQIRGMTSGFTKGPEALEAITKALRLDPQNGWAVFSNARMHYHNPAIAGGDKDLALKELRDVVRSIPSWRVYHYLSLTYDAKDMTSQAWFWAQKAQRAAPDNPEVALQVRTVAEKRKEER